MIHLKYSLFFTELNVFFGARLMIFWDIIVGHFVIQVGFGDLLSFMELHGYRVCLFQIRMSPEMAGRPVGSQLLTSPLVRNLSTSLRKAPLGGTLWGSFLKAFLKFLLTS